MSKHNLIVIGTSAGGITVLSNLLKLFPVDLNAAVLIVMHLSPHRASILPDILNNVSKLPVHVANDGTKILCKHVYIAPPNYHMLVKKNKIHLTSGPTVNYSRPAIDPLFYSAAVAYGSKTFGVLCSGMLDDGTAGFAAIKNHGGVTIVQDPKEAEYPEMPRNALESGVVDYSLPILKIASLLVKLSSNSTVTPIKLARENSMKSKIIGGQDYITEEKTLEQIGAASVFSCPECNGTLWEINEEKITRFRCRIGHAYGIESLLVAHTDSLERIMWIAVRALEESASIAKRIAEKNHASADTTKHFIKRAKVAEENAKKLRNFLFKNNEQN
jgi:two-component system chemotaxis response regulator CheB